MNIPVTEGVPDLPQHIQIAVETIARYMQSIGGNYLEGKMVLNGTAYYLSVAEGEL